MGSRNNLHALPARLSAEMVRKRMNLTKVFKKTTWALSMGAFLWTVGLGLYIAIYCPTIVRRTADGSRAMVLFSYLIIGSVLFAVIWAIYGFVRWVIVFPFIRMSSALKGVRKMRLDCPQCGRQLKGASTDMVGDVGVCPKCKAEFVIEQKDSSTSAKTQKNIGFFLESSKSKTSKGRVSNCIAWVFIVLQMMMTLGGLYAGGSRERIAFFNNSVATVQSVVFVTGDNILGIVC